MLKSLPFSVLAVASSCVLLSGCQPDDETRDFFYTGWVNPGETARPQPLPQAVDPAISTTPGTPGVPTYPPLPMATEPLR